VADLLAGTWVVEAPRPRLMDELATVPRPAFTSAPLGAHGIKKLHALGDVSRGRTDTTMAAVVRLAKLKLL